MNNIKSLEEFTSVVTNIFVTLHERGELITPVAYPQPWNDSKFNPRYEKEWSGSSGHWRFACYVEYENPDKCNRNVFKFKGLNLTVYVSDATMEGRGTKVAINSVEDILPALETLDAFRQDALNSCMHAKYVLVSRLGRCFNRYRCVDCGTEFNIDSGD